LKVLGISPLDKDATASLVEDGRVLAAAGEERFTRRKQQSGFPSKAVQYVLESTHTSPAEIDRVVYPFLDWEQETRLMRECLDQERMFLRDFDPGDVRGELTSARARIPKRSASIEGLPTPNQRMEKGWAKNAFYRLFGTTPPLSTHTARFLSERWLRRASSDHRWWQARLERGLTELGLLVKLERSEHHLSHASNAYLTGGFERALVITLDGYGSGLAGSISLGEGGRIKRLHGLRFPHSLGSLYEMVTSSLGFHPDRHAGKVVGLAAHGDPTVLSDVLLHRGRNSNGDLSLFENLNVYFSRYLAAHFPMVDVAAAYQQALEVWACSLVRHWLARTGCEHVVLSGGVAANVKMNQRIHELEGVKSVFVYPNMGDGGCGTGLALARSWPGGAPEAMNHVYYGPSYGEAECLAALRKAGLDIERPSRPAAFLAERLHAGDVVARFSGAMEYGPRALGNRSVLYHGRDADVNRWLNRRLGRTEFMPFAPVTLWERRDRCYHGMTGAEHAAEFMTITFDCTDWMKANCPAAVHVDGTARPQLIRRETNPEYYDVLVEYEKLSGVPCLVNTSFNMHEEPIVCAPEDAVRAFIDGRLDGLAMGPFYARRPAGRDPARAPAGPTRDAG
jgi:carbamoyltransferase